MWDEITYLFPNFNDCTDWHIDARTKWPTFCWILFWYLFVKYRYVFWLNFCSKSCHKTCMGANRNFDPIWISPEKGQFIALFQILLPRPTSTQYYCDVIMGAMASQITSLTIIYSTVYSVADKKNIKAPRHWPLCGEFTGDRLISSTNGQ